jgi:hypothetical protein
MAIERGVPLSERARETLEFIRATDHGRGPSRAPQVSRSHGGHHPARAPEGTLMRIADCGSRIADLERRCDMTSRVLMSAGVLLAVLVLNGCNERVPGTPLAAAVFRGDIAEIDRLVAGGANVNEPSLLKDWPPVIHAIHKHQKAALVRLLEHGASLDGQIGRNALKMASGYGDAGIVHVLLSRGAKVPTTDGGAGTLMTAAVGGAWDIDYDWTGCDRHTQVVRTLLAHDPGLRRHLPNRVKGVPYSPASLVEGVLMKKFATWFVRRKGCDEPLRIMES